MQDAEVGALTVQGQLGFYKDTLVQKTNETYKQTKIMLYIKIMFYRIIKHIKRTKREG
jgi:hypothetical protein